MALGLSATEANSYLTTLAGSATWVKLHTGDPGAAGTSNAAGNTTRIQATWGTPAGGVVANTNTLTWPAVSTTETYTHWSLWTASTAGTFKASGTTSASGITAGDDFVVAVGQLTYSLLVAA